MLQVHAGSIWIGQKIVEKVREHSQTTMRRNIIVRMTLDKVMPLVGCVVVSYSINVCSNLTLLIHCDESVHLLHNAYQ